MADRDPIRLLVVNGCEHTAERARHDGAGWPDHLAEHLHVPLLNLAMPQASNHRIVRTTVSGLALELERRRVQPRELAFVAMFTHPDRTEVGTDAPAGLFGRRAATGAVGWHPIGRWGVAAGDERARAWYHHVQDPTSDLVNLFLGASLLGRWLERFGCHFAFALAAGWGAPPDADAAIANYVRRIEPTWLVGGDLTNWPTTRLLGDTNIVTNAAASSDVHRAWTKRFLAPRFD